MAKAKVIDIGLARNAQRANVLFAEAEDLQQLGRFYDALESYVKIINTPGVSSQLLCSAVEKAIPIWLQMGENHLAQYYAAKIYRLRTQKGGFHGRESNKGTKDVLAKSDF